MNQLTQIKHLLILKGSMRLDKNQNFNIIPTQAISGIYNINENHTIRSTFTSAIRNPTLLNQYQYYNIGRAKLVGNINGYENLYTIESIYSYSTSGRNTDSLVSFNLDPIRPEEVKCLEFGYRGALGGKLFIDANYYYNWYTNFIGFINGAKIFVDALGLEVLDVYRVATNSEKIITTQGFSTGLNYYLDNQFTINGNYSWNVLNKENDDPIIPAYNTPEHKFNLGVSGKEIDLKILDLSLLKKISFNLNYKWVKGFEFEGSPQFTGYVPSYGLLDFQMTKDKNGKKLYKKVLSTVQTWGENIMFVVGATRAEMLREVRSVAPESFLLVPGVGAQGGSLEEVAENGLNDHCGLLVNSSRGIIYASSDERFADEARRKAMELQQQMELQLVKKGLI